MSQEVKTPDFNLAKRKLEAVIGFKIHFIVYLGVNALLLFLNILLFNKKATLPSGQTVDLPFIAYFWVIWPICGWGIGVVIHYLVVRKFSGPLADSWKMPKVQDFMQPQQKQGE